MQDALKKRSRNNNKTDKQEVEHHHAGSKRRIERGKDIDQPAVAEVENHNAGGKRRIGRSKDIDQEAVATSSKELDAKLQVEQLSFAKEKVSTGISLTTELEEVLANQQRQEQKADIEANIDALQISVSLHNRTADIIQLQEANRKLRSITPLPRPTSWQVKQGKQLPGSRN